MTYANVGRAVPPDGIYITGFASYRNVIDDLPTAFVYGNLEDYQAHSYRMCFFGRCSDWA